MAGNLRDRLRDAASAAAQSRADGVGAPVSYIADRGEPWSVPQRIPAHPQSQIARSRTPGLIQTLQTSAGPATRDIDVLATPLVISGALAVLGIGGRIIEAPAGRRSILGLRNAGAFAIAIDFGVAASANSFLILQPVGATFPNGQAVMFDSRVPQNDVYALPLDGNPGEVAFIYSDMNVG